MKSKKRFSCHACDKTYAGNFNLKDHVRIVHEGKRDFRCDLCEKPFGRKETLKTHLALVHGKVEINEDNLTRTAEKKYSCEFCEKSYTRPHNLKSHMESCHRLVEENVSKLPQNDILTSGLDQSGNGSYLPNNEKKNSVKSYEEDLNQIKNVDKICETKNAEIMDFVDDVEMKNENVDLVDRISQEKSPMKNVHEGANNSILDQFEIELEATNKYLEKNEYPNYSEGLISLKKPENVVTNFNNVTTSNTKIIGRITQEKSPMKNVHDGANYSMLDNFEIKSETNTNSIENNEYSNYSGGMTSQKKLKNFVPSFNNITTSNTISTTKSVNENTFQNEIKPSTKKNPCKQCDKSYAWPFLLKNHIKTIHENLKEFQCDQPDCNANFGRRATLIQHLILVHGIVATKDKNDTKHARKYRCKNCDKGYTTSTNLKLHMKNVHDEGKNALLVVEEEKFKCDNCKIENKANFNSKELLELHMLQYHSNE